MNTQKPIRNAFAGAAAIGLLSFTGASLVTDSKDEKGIAAALGIIAGGLLTGGAFTSSTKPKHP